MDRPALPVLVVSLSVVLAVGAAAAWWPEEVEEAGVTEAGDTGYTRAETEAELRRIGYVQ